MRPLLPAQMLPACDLQAVLPECSQLPENVCETHELLQRVPGEHLCSQVRCSGSSLRCSSSGHLCGSVCAQVRSGSSLCSGLCGSGSGHLRGSVCAQMRSGSRLCSGLCGSGHVCGSVCAQVRSGSRKLRRSVRSGSSEVLRYALPDQVLQCGSLRSRSLDL